MTNAEWLDNVAGLLDVDAPFKLAPHDRARLLEAAADLRAYERLKAAHAELVAAAKESVHVWEQGCVDRGYGDQRNWIDDARDALDIAIAASAEVTFACATITASTSAPAATIAHHAKNMNTITTRTAMSDDAEWLRELALEAELCVDSSEYPYLDGESAVILRRIAARLDAGGEVIGHRTLADGTIVEMREILPKPLPPPPERKE